ncbi:MAG: hypothetical protein LAO78_05975 [Acidobacteriia bacterium]|nr:hypothetical protein [Terriglobia bacterium]
MATHKAKRSIHLAQHQLQTQTQTQPAAKLLPVKAYIYRAIAEMNAGFELTMQELKRLQQVDFLPSTRIAAMHIAVGELRAQANREFLDIITQRETANAGHFERLAGQRQSPPQLPPAS